MALPESTLRKRAVKAGVKASKKLHHPVTEQELLSLRIQVMPALLRWAMILAGILLIVAAWMNWPSDSGLIQSIEAVAGIFLIAFGSFGIRRTIDHLANSPDFVETLVELVGEAVSNIDL